MRYAGTCMDHLSRSFSYAESLVNVHNKEMIYHFDKRHSGYLA